MDRKIFLVVLLAVACVSATPSDPRDKRSYSWLPKFLGGGSAPAADETVEAADEAVPVEVDNQIQSGETPVQQLAHPNEIGQIIGNGKVVGNQVHYPVWRVHKYQGINMQPLPIYLEREPDSAVNPQLPPSSSESRLPPSAPNVENWLTPELIEMARKFGVTSFSNLPSLESTMDFLGTQTKEETIEVIKDFAKTEDGRQLIRDYVEGANTQDNEVAAAENVESVKAVENTDEGAQYAKVIEENLSNAELDGDSTVYFNQFLLPQGQLIPQIATLRSAPAQTEEQSEEENPDAVETTTPASFFGRVSQWVNFLNPLANRQEIPIPPSADEAEETVLASSGPKDESNSNQQTVSVSNLPELPPLPPIPGAEQPVPQLPIVHIPAQYVTPNLRNGAYVRVKLPAAGFNPTPQYKIDPKYLNYALNQLKQGPIPQYFIGSDGVQRPYYQQVAVSVQPQPKPVAVNHAKVGSEATPKITINQSTDFNKQIYSTPQTSSPQLPSNKPPKVFLQRGVATNVPAQQMRLIQPIQVAQQLPNNEPQQFGVVQPITNIGNLPLAVAANYEVFKNAPQIENSYGAPALPIEFETQPNTYWVSPQSKAVHIYRQYEIQPSASEIVERRIKGNDAEEPKATSDVDEQPVDEAVEKNVEVEDEETNVQSNNNDKITPDTNRTNENDQPDQTKANAVTEALSLDEKKQDGQFVEKEQENIDAKNEPDVEKTPSTEASYRKLRKNRRNKQHDNIVTGRLYRADQNAVEMLPFTLRKQQMDDRKKANNNNE